MELKVIVSKGTGKGGSDTLLSTDVKRGKIGGTIVGDEYMDPQHLIRGDEGYKEYTKAKTVSMGEGLLAYIQKQYPQLAAYPKAKGVKFRAHPEGELMESIYEVRTRHVGGMSWLFPKTLIRVSTDNGMMASERFDVAENLKQDKGLLKLAVELGLKNGIWQPFFTSITFKTSEVKVKDWVKKELGENYTITYSS